jgi:hypothetical protein
MFQIHHPTCNVEWKRMLGERTKNWELAISSESARLQLALAETHFIGN